jgi:ClpP class serine protease
LSELQQDIHETFKAHVRRRRLGKIDADDETLFSGEVLTGRMALTRGLIDGIGDLRSVMRARFGDNVRLVPVATERRRRWWMPRPRRFVERDLWTPVADVIGWLEARALWARFGL